MLRMLSDEDLPGDIVRSLRQRQPELDIVRAQEVGLMQTDDPDILEWAAREGRQVITRDRGTMTRHAYDRVAAALPMPGVFLVPENMPIGQAIKETGVYRRGKRIRGMAKSRRVSAFVAIGRSPRPHIR